MNKNDTISIYCGNIEEFSRRRRISEAQRVGMVNELLGVLVAESSAESAGEVYEEFMKVLPTSTYEDRARLCMKLYASPRYGTQMRKSCFFGENIAAGSHGKVSLVRNSYNERAFSHFSAIIRRPKDVIAPSFAAACEEVYDNRSEFCILPVENAQSGRLFGFYSMLDRYELRICAVCEPDSEDNGDGGVKYALVGRSVPDRISKNASWSFEFSVISDSGRDFFEISRVSEIFGARLVKIDSLPVEYDGGLQKYYFTFGLPEASIPAFDLFLNEEYSRYTAVGMYPTV